jgi:putative hydrolase of the HAD superfamily
MVLEFERIEGTVTELEGVIRTFPQDRDRAIENRYRLPHGAIAQVAFTSSPIALAVSGKISDAAWRAGITSRLKSLFPEVDCESAVRDWSNFAGVVDFGVLNELKKLKQLGPLILVTNATNRLEPDLIELGIYRHFDQIINSSSVGYAKPSFEIYKLALFHLKLPAEKVLWIENTPAHLRTATGLGFHTHHYQSLDSLRREVEKRLNPLK